MEVDQLAFACQRPEDCAAGYGCYQGRCALAPPEDAGVPPACNPTCTSGAICDEATGRCVLPGLVCHQVPAVGGPTGFDAMLAGMVPRDGLILGQALCGADGVRLTIGQGQAGAFFLDRAYTLAAFRVTLEFAIGPSMEPAPTAGDGMALVFGPGPPSLGGAGSWLGVIGTGAYFLELDTLTGRFPLCTEATEPDAPHVAFARSVPEALNTGEFCNYPIYAAAEIGPIQHNGFHQLVVEVDPARIGGEVEVRLDGAHVLTASVAAFAPGPYYFGASAGTGAAADTHVIRRLQLEAR